VRWIDVFLKRSPMRCPARGSRASRCSVTPALGVRPTSAQRPAPLLLFPRNSCGRYGAGRERQGPTPCRRIPKTPKTRPSRDRAQLPRTDRALRAHPDPTGRGIPRGSACAEITSSLTRTDVHDPGDRCKFRAPGLSGRHGKTRLYGLIDPRSCASARLEDNVHRSRGLDRDHANCGRRLRPAEKPGRMHLPTCSRERCRPGRAQAIYQCIPSKIRPETMNQREGSRSNGRKSVGFGSA